MTNACTPHVLMGAAFTTYRIGGPLVEAYQPATEREMIAILREIRVRGQRPTMLGWGGNSLVASQGIGGATLITRKLDRVEQTSPVSFVLGAGVHLAKVSSTALKQALTGAEYMIGIPGTIGGAVRMNAGALGQETGQIVQSVTLFNMDSGEVECWPREQLAFQYRKSAIDPQRHIILSVEIMLNSGDPMQISALMEKSVHFRKTHHPKEPNGGSVFKNPAPDKPVGRLIEVLGGKGHWREGGVMISPLHGNFIINVDHGTSTDVLKLMLKMKQAIGESYGLNVRPENLLLGDATDEETVIWEDLNREPESR